jgi:hypothetical protein
MHVVVPIPLHTFGDMHKKNRGVSAPVSKNRFKPLGAEAKKVNQPTISVPANQ